MVMADEELKEAIDNIISQLDTAQNYQKINISSIYRKYRPILKESIEKEIAAWNSQCVKRGNNLIYQKIAISPSSLVLPMRQRSTTARLCVWLPEECEKVAG